MLENNLKYNSPIFIIGAPRSGNTLIGCLLNKHPQLIIFFETQIFATIYRKWVYINSLNPSKERNNFVSLISRYMNFYNQKLSIDEESISRKVCNSKPEFAYLMDSYMQLLIDRSGFTSSRWGDKSPANTLCIDQILAVYPLAKIIYVYRDPRHIVSSMSNKSFTPSSDDFLINAHVLKKYNDRFNKLKNKIHKDNLIEINFDILTSSPKSVLTEVSQFLDIEYTDNFLKPVNENKKKLIGWEEYKGWNEVSNKAVQAITPIEDKVECYISEITFSLGYKLPEITNSFWKKNYAVINLSPLLFIEFFLSFLYVYKYPNFYFILSKYPDFKKLSVWLRNNAY